MPRIAFLWCFPASECPAVFLVSRGNCRLNAAFDDSGGNGKAGKAGDIVDMQLLHEMLAMLFDRFNADAQV